MPLYRAYELDEKGHVFGPPVIIAASNDTDALVRAKHLIDGRDLEIWDEARRVGLVERGARFESASLPVENEFPGLH
jgi:hypothetical protein